MTKWQRVKAWWREKRARMNERLKGRGALAAFIALGVLVVAIIFSLVDWKAPATVQPTSSGTVTETKEETVTTTTPSGTVTESTKAGTVTAQTTPAPTPKPAIEPPPAKAPVTKAEKKTEERVMKTETSKPRSVVTAPPVTRSPAPAEKAATAPAATPPQGKPFLWIKVGADPCNPKVGCTLAWALEQSKWPLGVQSAFMDKVRGESPVAYTMYSGWQGWMTWGKHERKFRANTLASWPSGQAEAADLWSVAYEGVNYHLVRVQKCKNWGGFTTTAQAPTRPLQPASPGVMPLGVIPTVACPDETE